jgi:Secretion system C-terminal sorting domain
MYSQTLSWPKSGIYMVVTQDENGCEISEETTVIVESCGEEKQSDINKIIPTQNRESVSNFSQRNEVVLYPNPTNQDFTLIIPQDMGLCRIEVFDALTRKVKMIEGQEQLEIQTTSWVQGMYFIKLTPLNKDKKSVSVWTNVIIGER